MSHNYRIFQTAIFVILISIVFSNCKVQQQNTSTENKSIPYYTLIIDATETGSKLYVYRIIPISYANIPLVEFVAQKKVTPSILKFHHQKDNILSNMDMLLHFAKTHIPIEQHKNTRLYLMGTAGMRLMDKKQRTETMDALSHYFSKTVFDFKESMVLSGQYESLYAWTALNYNDDSFSKLGKRESLLEMNQASTQIAFLTEDTHSKDVIQRKYAGVDYSIFAKSYLNMGQERAKKITNTTSCFPKGYPIDNSGRIGTGDFTQCYLDLKQQLCNYMDSIGINDCLFNKGYRINTENEFIAIETFYNTFDFFNMYNHVDLKQLKEKGTEFCNQNWTDIQQEHDNSSYLKSYCFNAAYFWAMLDNGYGFNEEVVIRTKKSVNNKEITWTLGAVIDMELGHRPQKYYSQTTHPLAF